MRNLILQEFVSLDGRASGPSDSVNFVPAAMQGDKSFGERQLQFMDSIDAILLGRVTYTMFAGHWPNVKSGEDKQFADKINATSKIVFTKTLTRAPWGTWDDARIVKTDAAREVARLKETPGKDMVIWGSLSLAQSLIDEGLIDDYQLIVCPVVLGNGRSLFRDKDSLEMRLLDTRSFDRGAVLLSYEAAKVPATAAR